jgi:hypothetical protein
MTDMSGETDSSTDALADMPSREREVHPLSARERELSDRFRELRELSRRPGQDAGGYSREGSRRSRRVPWRG